jgi:hypothetical protein
MGTGNWLDQMSVCSLFVILRLQVQPSTVTLKMQTKLYITLETNLEGMSRAKILNVAQERLKSDGEMAVQDRKELLAEAQGRK